MPYECFPQRVAGRWFFDEGSLCEWERDQEVESWCEAEPPEPPPVLPEVMTAEETCRYLRLDIERSMPLALKALNRLVDEKKVLTPTMYRKRRMFTRAECDRMAEKMQRNRD